MLAPWGCASNHQPKCSRTGRARARPVLFCLKHGYDFRHEIPPLTPDRHPPAGNWLSLPDRPQRTARRCPGAAGRSCVFAHLKITLDPKAASDYGVDPKRVDEVITDFAAKHDSFTLTDLQNLKVPAGPDKNLLLSEIATLDVQFNQTPVKP